MPPRFLRQILRVGCLLGLASAPMVAMGQSLIWTYSGPSGAEFYSSPAVTSDGFYVIGTSGGLPGSATNRVICFRRTAVSQTVRWNVQLPDWVDSSPALSGDGQTAYVGCWDGKLYALNITNGNTRWSFTTGGYIASSPAVASDGTIYLSSADGLLYALNPTGTLRWFYVVGAEMESSPAIAPDGSVVVGTLDGRVIALRADGTLKWEFWAEELPGEDNRIRASPAIGADGTVYAGSGNGRLYAIDFAGRLLWGIATPEAVDSSPVVAADGTVFFANRFGYLTAVDEDGFELWSVLLGDIFFSSPVLDSAGNVYVVAFSGNNTSTLHCRTAEGIQRFTLSLPTVVDSSPTLSTTGINNDQHTLVVGGYNGIVYGVRALAGLADSPWPKHRRDLRQVARTVGGEGPSILAAPQSSAALLGSQIDLRALGNGANALDYQWYRNGVLLPGAEGATLQLGAADLTTPGAYVCRILSAFGEVDTAPAWLTVFENPTVAAGTLKWRFHQPAGSGAPAISPQVASQIGAWSGVASVLESTSGDGTVETRTVSVPASTSTGFLRLTINP